MILSRLLAYRFMGWRKRDLAGLGLALVVGLVVGSARLLKDALDAILNDQGVPW